MVENKEYVERPQWQSYEDLSKNQKTKVWDFVKGHVMRQVPVPGPQTKRRPEKGGKLNTSQAGPGQLKPAGQL